MIHHVSGKLGSGKSMFCAQVIADWIMQFKTVVTNIPLVDGWDFILSKYKCGGLGSAFHYLRSDFVRSLDFQANLALAYARKYHYYFDIHDACQAAIDMGPAIEASRLFIFDEAQLFINSRSWKERSKVITEFTTQSRKLGFEVYLVSQEKDSVDKQVRNLADYHYSLKNLGHIRPLGLKIFPNVGQLVKRHPDTGTLIGLKYISYSRWISQLYKTNQLFSVRQPAPVPWSQEMKNQMWFSGCKARYERGVCEFKRIASDQELRFIVKNIQPFIGCPDYSELAKAEEPEIVPADKILPL